MKYVLSKPLSYPDAIEEAKNCGGRLASMNTRESRELFLKLGLQTPSAVWIGLQSPHTMWANGALVARGPNYWHPGEPSNKNGKEKCVEIRSDVLLNDNDCMWAQPALIEITTAQQLSMLDTLLNGTSAATQVVYVPDTSQINRWKLIAMGFWFGFVYGIALLLTVYPCPAQKKTQPPSPPQPPLPSNPSQPTPTPALAVGKPLPIPAPSEATKKSN